MKANAKSETVKVAVRVRPMNKNERENNSIVCVDVDPSSNQISVSDPKKETKTFQFDYVYPMETTQRQVYDQVAFPIVESIFQGYNGTIFAYGQTGCGKTYTMMGIVSNPTQRGVIPNAFEHIFGVINSEDSSKRFLIRCSFVEIYNEEVRDLLGKNPNKALDIREDPRKGTFVKDLAYIPLKNTSEIVECLDRGNQNRHVGVTSMNDQSSRSHSLFTVYVEIEEGEEKSKKIRSGKLNLVDLAGSERVGKTKATGQTFDEGKKINLSLTALGSVIDALSSNRKHIPYKDSKLTRLLADSLGGNTKTVMFANVSPASYNYEETVGTLRYASRAKLIKNAPKVNEDPKDALLRKYEEEIKLLKQQLEGKITMNLRNQKNTGAMDPNEKMELLEKIAELQKEMIDGGTKGHDDRGEIIKGDENEEERKKFNEYRKKQIKNVEEMERKYAMLEEQKKKEEEALKNDVNNLKKIIKSLKSEIEDLKLDNEKDRTDFMESIKDINKDNKLYKGIIKFLLSDVELKKVIDMSRYDEDNERWTIHPFCFREKQLELPKMKQGQIPVFIEGELEKREFILGIDDKKEQKKEVSYDPSLLKNKAPKKQTRYKLNSDIPILASNTRDFVPKKTIRNFEKTSINTRPPNIFHNRYNSSNFGGYLSIFNKDSRNDDQGGLNILSSHSKLLALSQNERERLQDLPNFNRKNNDSFPSLESSIITNNHNLIPIKQGTKIILDPVDSKSVPYIKNIINNNSNNNNNNQRERIENVLKSPPPVNKNGLLPIKTNRILKKKTTRLYKILEGENHS